MYVCNYIVNEKGNYQTSNKSKKQKEGRNMW